MVSGEEEDGGQQASNYVDVKGAYVNPKRKLSKIDTYWTNTRTLKVQLGPSDFTFT